LEVSQRVKPSTLKEVNLNTSETPQTMLISKDLKPALKSQLINLVRQYKDVFAWTLEDMQGLDPKFYQHTINLAKDAVPVQQRHYRLNPNYATRVKEEIDELLKVRFIRSVKKATWLSSIVIFPKKNRKLRVCLDY
jgi:hypothetical protein